MQGAPTRPGPLPALDKLWKRPPAGSHAASGNLSTIDSLNKDQTRARRRSEPLRSEVPGTAQMASWKMIPSVVRSPECTVDTPWRIATR